jgi:hypothetical protein
MPAVLLLKKPASAAEVKPPGYTNLGSDLAMRVLRRFFSFAAREDR